VPQNRHVNRLQAHKLQTFNNRLTIARACCPNIFWRGAQVAKVKGESLIQSVIG
jgi:hypothetical protein